LRVCAGAVFDASGLISDITCSCRPKMDLRATMERSMARDIFPAPPGCATNRGALGISIPGEMTVKVSR